MDRRTKAVCWENSMNQTTVSSGDPRGSLPQIIINWEGLYEGNLVKYFQALFYTAENLNLPYHNFRHCTHVFYLCYEASRFYKDELSKRRIRNLLIAAKFHDFNHTGVVGDDALNIERSVAALRQHLDEYDRDSLEDIVLLLQGSQYPYILGDDKLPLEGLILRDADLMQAFSTAWIQQVVFGLAAEWGKTPIEVLALQQKFLGNIVFKTEWGRLLVPKAAIALKINEAQALLDILTMPTSPLETREALEV